MLHVMIENVTIVWLLGFVVNCCGRLHQLVSETSSSNINYKNEIVSLRVYSKVLFVFVFFFVLIPLMPF